MCSIKTFTQTRYNKQKQDSDLMKKILSFPEGHNNQSAPLVQWNMIQTGQTQEKETSGICLILCNKQKKEKHLWDKRQKTWRRNMWFIFI